MRWNNTEEKRTHTYEAVKSFCSPAPVWEFYSPRARILKDLAATFCLLNQAQAIVRHGIREGGERERDVEILGIKVSRRAANSCKNAGSGNEIKEENREQPDIFQNSICAVQTLPPESLAEARGSFLPRCTVLILPHYWASALETCLQREAGLNRWSEQRLRSDYPPLLVPNELGAANRAESLNKIPLPIRRFQVPGWSGRRGCRCW